jgi:C-terminal processing protease CtpA/Prc
MGGDREFRRDLVAAMGRVRGTKGLVIDVRGNGGGSRDALLVLFPFFMTPADPPRVANVAAYQLREGDLPDAPEGYLTDRFLHPAASPVWSDADRAAIRAFAAGFKPEWAPPAGAFSGWHYLLLKPRAGAGYYHYDRPVVVLADAGCFSATDIFLGAFKGWRGVTLVGTASGGGSGRAQPLVLHHSGLELQLSSIASYRPDGKLYDGRGVEPDVEVKPVPTDLIGRTDSVLDAALKRLR